MHTENVSDDGEITDGGELSVATYYSACVGIINADGYVRVVCDAPGHYTETRVDHATLIAAGWSQRKAAETAAGKPDGQAENADGLGRRTLDADSK